MLHFIEPVILIHKIDFELPENIYLYLLYKIREDKQEKIKRFKFRKDALRSLCGELLLKYALEKYYNIEYEKENIEEDEFGKPYLSNRQIFFNISHSGNWSAIVCFVNDAGIDIERIDSPPFEIMPKNYTQNETDQIEDTVPEDKALMFYKFWTLKESYIKMIGQGLLIPLDSFSIDIRNKNSIIVKDKNRPAADIHFQLFSPDSEHIMAVCLRNYFNEIKPFSVPFSSLFPG